MKRIAILIVSFIFCVGCASSLKTRRAYVDNHPNLSPQTKRDILKRAVSVGMSQEQFLIIMPRPDRVHRRITKYKVYEQWVYDNSKRHYCFENGILASCMIPNK